MTIAAYARVYTFGFVAYDDPRYIFDNPHIATGLTWANLRWVCTTVYGPYWHPLTLVSHMADVQIFGLWAGGHHVTSLLLHIVNTLLLFTWLRRTTGAVGRSAFVAALFAVHPLHVESVAWLTERLDTLSTLFGLLTMWAYVRWIDRRTSAGLALMLTGYACALLSKPVLITLPVLLLLLDGWPLGRLKAARDLVPLITEKIPLFLLAGAAAALTLTFEVLHGSVAGLDRLPLTFRLSNALMSYMRYLGKTLWPVSLGAFYPFEQHLPDWWVLAGAVAILAGVSMTVWQLRRQHPYLIVGWLWYLISLLPVIGLVQAADQAMADRFMYLPLVGLGMMVAWGLPNLFRQRSARFALAAAAVLAIVLCAAVTRVQTETWRNTIALWTRAIEVTTGNHRAYAGLGEALVADGRAGEAIPPLQEAVRLAPYEPVYHAALGQALSATHQVAAAISEYQVAIRLKPDVAGTHTNLGNAQASSGQLDEAIAQFQQALRLAPDVVATRVSLAMALLRQGKAEEATREVNDALRLDAQSAHAHGARAAIAQVQGDVKTAIAEYAEAIRIDPKLAAAHSNLASALATAGDAPRAMEEYTEALRLDPLLPDAHNGLGVILMGQQRLPEAIAHYVEALRLSPRFVLARQNLGVALATKGDIDGAIREFTEIVRIDPANVTARAAIEHLKKSK